MKLKRTQIRRYLNPVSQIHLLNDAPYNTLIAGRGFSKSFTNGIDQARKVELMPRSLGLFTSPTYSMIYTKTLIPMKAAWEQHFGYVEGVHYVVGKVPPAHFERPWHKPHRYENVVSFLNGRAIAFGSFDRPALISGGSYDDVVNDECYLIDKDDYDNYVIPTVRGTHPSFKDVPIHLQQRFTSSMPHRNQGDYLLDYYQKAKSNPKMYGFIGWDPDPNVKVQLGSTWMNVEHLGRKAIEQMEAEMSVEAVMVMIKNMKVSNWGNLFYPVLSKKHWYTPKANDKLISIPLSGLTFKRNATHDVGTDDYNPDKPLHLSHDWGVFNCMTIDQEYPKEIRVINTMHVHNPKILTDLAAEFDEYYKQHRCKVVYQWGDRTGNNKLANSKRNHFEKFGDVLRANGWRVVLKKTGDIEHLDRHLFINKVHSEQDPRLKVVRYNTRCADFRIAMESAGMKDHKKDKSSELNAAIKPEHATHYTDAHDYRIYHGLKYLEDNPGGMSSGSSIG